jgi:hypothetical protein
MIIKLLIYNKRSETIQDFTSRAKAYVRDARKIMGIHIIEDHNGQILWKFFIDDTVAAKQEMHITEWVKVEELEVAVNATLESIRSQNRVVRYVEILTLAKSPRALASIITERPNEAPKAQKKKSDKDVNGSANSSTKRSRKSRNRKHTSE